MSNDEIGRRVLYTIGRSHHHHRFSALKCRMRLISCCFLTELHFAIEWIYNWIGSGPKEAVKNNASLVETWNTVQLYNSYFTVIPIWQKVIVRRSLFRVRCHILQFMQPTDWQVFQTPTSEEQCPYVTLGLLNIFAFHIAMPTVEPCKRFPHFAGATENTTRYGKPVFDLLNMWPDQRGPRCLIRYDRMFS